MVVAVGLTFGVAGEPLDLVYHAPSRTIYAGVFKVNFNIIYSPSIKTVTSNRIIGRSILLNESECCSSCKCNRWNVYTVVIPISHLRICSPIWTPVFHLCPSSSSVKRILQKKLLHHLNQFLHKEWEFLVLHI